MDAINGNNNNDGSPNLKKKKSKHVRSMTVNISKGIFGRKINRLRNKNKGNKGARVESNTNHSFGDMDMDDDNAPDLPSQNNNYGNSSRSLNHLSNHMDYKDDNDDYGHIKGKHKSSVNFDDVEEEEKYHQPSHVTAGGGGNKHLSVDRAKKKSSYGSTDDIEDDRKTIMSEATDATELKLGAGAANHHRDPTKLAFDVNPIMMTTQVGTLAFMAPEILSHVNIGALSGGWANKEDDKDKDKEKEKKNIDIIEEDKDMEYEDEEQKYPQNNTQQKQMERQHQLSKSVPKGNMNELPLPIERNKKYPQNSPNMVQSGSGNHLAIAHPRHHNSTESKASEWTTTESADTQSTVSNAKSDTVVITINTKTDPYYQNNNNNNAKPINGNYNGNGKYLNPQNQLNMVHEDAITSPATFNTNPKSMKSEPTGNGSRDFPIIRNPQKGGNGMTEMKVWTTSPAPNVTNAQKRFSREYIRKHRQLSQSRARITPPPKKALPPAPPPGMGLFGRGRNGSASITSTVSQSFKNMFTSSKPTSSWENRDIYFYNQRNNVNNNYGNAYSQYTNKPSPSPNMYGNYITPSPQTYQVGLKSPNNNNLNLPNSYGGSNNNHNYLLSNGNNLQQQNNIYQSNNNGNNNSYNTAPKQNQISNGQRQVPPIGNRASMTKKKMPSKPIPQPPMASLANFINQPNHEINDPRFSTTSTINRRNFQLKNPHKYMQKQLPPDPPKKKEKKGAISCSWSYTK